MKGLAVLLAVFSIVSAFSGINTQWEEFKTRHSKSYSKAEDSIRKITFAKNLERVNSHNKLYQQGLVSHQLSLNQFSDISDDEFKQTRLGYKKSENYSEQINIIEYEVPSDAEIPEEFDWRDYGAVTPIKDQGSCGSCWTFSSTGALEGQYFKKTGKLVSISEQNLVDCSFESGNAGCGGGDMPPAFQYVHNNDGIDSEQSYPYTARNGRCTFGLDGNVTSTSVTVVQVRVGNEEDLKVALITLGPLAVAIDASNYDFQLYSSGVYYNSECLNGEDDYFALDHAVVLIGYGNEGGLDYWLVKNSWGTNWGEAGYIKMSRNRNNNCGIATEAVVPVLY